MNIEQTAQTLAVNIPFFGLFWYALKRIEKKDEDLKEMNKTLTTLVENNTKALGTMAQTVGEQNAMAKTLNDRIYDVLTIAHGK